MRRRPDPSALAAGLADLEALLPGRVERSASVCQHHANTLSWIRSEPPDAVVWPETEGEVAEIVRIAAAHRIPVVPYGAGTSLEGHLNAPLGGISVDLSRLDRILSVNSDDLDAEVEAGVTRDALNAHLRDTGLFFAVDPGAGHATIGGMAATRASGTNTVRYGTMRDVVLSLTAVMADGRTVTTGRRARKSAAGYDLTRLIVGSEGTLGLITRLTVRLDPIPQSVVAGVAPFSSLEGACRATIEAIQMGLALARIELLDALQLKAVNHYSKLAMPETPTLLLEFHGTPGATHDARVAFADIAASHGGLGFTSAEGDAERRRLWRARHDAFYAVKALWPGRAALVTDVCVPVSRLARCVAETSADLYRSGLIGPIVGHVGDGNFHVILMIDTGSALESDAARSFAHRLAERALEMDGTCTGEHGIGQGKLELLGREAGSGIEVMRQIKDALDPLGILNPGKLPPRPTV